MSEPDANVLFNYRLQYIKDRKNTLLAVKYQIAIAIYASMAAIWAILLSPINDINGKPLYDLIITFGIIICIFLIAGWRYITHIITTEINPMVVEEAYCLKELGANINDYIENIGRNIPDLYKNNTYCKLDSSQKLKVLNTLCQKQFDVGIAAFDTYSIIGMLVAAIIGTVTIIILKGSSLSLTLGIEIATMIIISVLCSLFVYNLCRKMRPSCEEIQNALPK